MLLSFKIILFLIALSLGNCVLISLSICVCVCARTCMLVFLMLLLLKYFQSSSSFCLFLLQRWLRVCFVPNTAGHIKVKTPRAVLQELMIGGTAGTAQAAGALVASAVLAPCVGSEGCRGSAGGSEGAAGGSRGAAH